MATTPEAFFFKDLTEKPPASPPVLLDLLEKPDDDNNEGHHLPNNDLMLPYISHMLMEDDDIDDELNDHPALLQVQQPFAQILSFPSIGCNTTNCALSLPLSKGTGVLGTCLKGMQEANIVLPKDKIFRRYELVNQSRGSNIIDSRVNNIYNTYHLLEPEDEEEEVRTTNKSRMVIDLEEKSGNKMLDKMTLCVFETCIKAMKGITINNNTDVEKTNRNSGRIKVVRDNAVDICTLLISCAQALVGNDNITTREQLRHIKQHALVTGDTSQRLAHYFANGLEARIQGTGSQLWQMAMLEYPSVLEFRKAYKIFSEAFCFVNVTFIFLAMTIMQAMVGKSRLHIVDYGMRFGFQWAGLLRLLASKHGGMPEVKITAIARPMPCHPDEQIEKIGCRLMKFADELGLPSFKFHTIQKNWEDISVMDLHTDIDEVLIVTDLFSFSILMEESIFFDSPSPRDIVLSNIKKMRPDVFIQNVRNFSCGSSFLTRFRETLFYYMAMFDILDATMPRESESRLLLEKVFLGRAVFNVISCEGKDLVEHPEKYKQWQARSQRAGLRQLQLKSSIVKMVKDVVKNHYHKDFMICQDGQWLLQGWMGRVLSAHTTWVADEHAS